MVLVSRRRGLEEGRARLRFGVGSDIIRQSVLGVEARSGGFHLGGQAGDGQAERLLRPEHKGSQRILGGGDPAWVGSGQNYSGVHHRRPSWAPRRLTSPGLWVWGCLHSYP
jgi:hypothetical protein